MPPVAAQAADLFRLVVEIRDATQKRGYANAEEALRAIEQENLERLFPDYQPTDPVNSMLNFRGLPMTARFAEESDVLMFEVPSLGISKSFGGPGQGGREGAVDAFVDFLKSEGGDILNRIQRELARVSPVDPIAGNPGSLQSSLVRDGFESGAFGTARRGPNDRIGIAVSASSFSAGDFRGRSVRLPLSYTFGFESNPGMKLKVGLPLAYQDVEGGEVYGASPGVALTVPLSDRWSLTPALTYGVTGSIDAASVAQMAGGMLTSRYDVPVVPGDDRTKLILGNMIGYVSTLPFSAGGYDFDPEIRNTALKNGTMIEHPLDMALVGDEPLELQFSYAHSYFAGTDLFLNQYHEVALSIGSKIVGGASALTDKLRFGTTYTFGSDYKSWSINFGYRF